MTHLGNEKIHPHPDFGIKYEQHDSSFIHTLTGSHVLDLSHAPVNAMSSSR
jgi:hypothetical protein